MELWVILTIGAFIFTWCSMFAFLHAKCLSWKTPPVGASVALSTLFVGWLILTGIMVPQGASLLDWMISTGIYVLCFMITLHKCEHWLRVIDAWLPFD